MTSYMCNVHSHCEMIGQTCSFAIIETGFVNDFQFSSIFIKKRKYEYIYPLHIE